MKWLLKEYTNAVQRYKELCEAQVLYIVNQNSRVRNLKPAMLAFFMNAILIAI
jgi:hypothetical protein